DVATGTLTWSDELYRMFGCDPADCPSTFEAFLARIHPDQRESVARKVRLAVESGTGWTMDEQIVRLDTGEVRTLLSKVRAMRDADGNITRLCGTCQDVTEQRRAEYALAASESRFRRSFDYAAVGMMMVEPIDGDGVILRMNNALAQLLGIEETSYTGMTLAELVVSDDWPLLHTILDRVVHDGSSGQVEVRLCGAGGKRPMVYASAARIGDAGSPRDVLVHIQDITERKAAEEQLRHRALHDPLTGLPNRTLLLDRLDLALARAERAEASVAVLFLDVDNFKLINDTIGHAAGDHMLRAIAKRIVDAGRIGDTAARVGGDEFVVVCENIAHEDEILTLAKRLSAAIATPISVNGAEFIASVSIGVAMASNRTHTPGELLRDADLAMYRAKQHGKNAIEIFDDELRKLAMERVSIERELRSALSNDEIVPYYQPIVALETGKLSGFEALARWQHPSRGLLLPRDFLPVAEETHLIGTLGSLMLRDACARLAAWQKAVPALTIAVNLSLRQLDGQFASVLVKSLQQWAIAYSALLVEVTESVLLDIHKSAVADLHAIAEAGIGIGIDDFGTGYSSLLYLKRFPVGFLKVDRTFVEGMPDDQDDIAIVSAIVRLAQSLGLATVAEGVETQKQLDLLQRLGCTYAQGNFIAPPLPAIECEKFLDGRGLTVTQNTVA
ncbi:MAG TPA: EAL domain-containing protein, partial [Candidatus Baltobacteraceae bacterium]|nr:EAL domain-containing protein [Candidatus Baltobacteraceae bacterium]